LTDALVAEYRRRHPEGRVGVIAVDPSSPFTGGAVLGDRVRMMRHATDPMVFVRSMASRGHLGGLTLGVRGVLRVLGLIGCELVLVETVGVGQSEVEVAKVADLVLIVLAPGQGDSIQLLKAGLMEIGDLFAVNKADRPGAAELHAALLSALQLDAIDPDHGLHHEAATPGLPPGLAPQNPAIEHLDLGFPRSGLRPTPEVYLVSSLEHTGLHELADALERQTAAHQERWMGRRKAAVQDEITDAILEEARERVAQALGANGTVAEQVQRVLSGEVSVKDLAQELLKKTCEKKMEPRMNANRRRG
jgi:LAO/AO transport system kinase